MADDGEITLWYTAEIAVRGMDSLEKTGIVWLDNEVIHSTKKLIQSIKSLTNLVTLKYNGLGSLIIESVKKNKITQQQN
jgi:hypothetical protein